MDKFVEAARNWAVAVVGIVGALVGWFGGELQGLEAAVLALVSAFVGDVRAAISKAGADIKDVTDSFRNS